MSDLSRWKENILYCLNYFFFLVFFDSRLVIILELKGMKCMDIVIVTSIGAVCMAIFAMFIRMKAAQKPASAKKILLPPFFMSTGALMYIFPEFRLTPLEILESVVVGMLFSILLIKTPIRSRQSSFHKSLRMFSSFFVCFQIHFIFSCLSAKFIWEEDKLKL